MLQNKMMEALKELDVVIEESIKALKRHDLKIMVDMCNNKNISEIESMSIVNAHPIVAKRIGILLGIRKATKVILEAERCI